jgi:hypothetical protein
VINKSLISSGFPRAVRVGEKSGLGLRRGRRLGPGDHLVEGKKSHKPDWMDSPTYDRMPALIEVREIHVHLGWRGFRAESFVGVTPLKDHVQYTKDDLPELHHARGPAELDIRAIKIPMAMNFLRRKTPERVRKEMWTCLAADNLIRQTILPSAGRSDRRTRDLSFTAAVQAVAAGRQVVALNEN